MGHPWNGPRHKSWASDTVLVAVLFLVILAATLITDWQNGPDQSAPAYLTGLLGASGAFLFGAAGSDRAKSQRESDDRSSRAESRTLTLNEDMIRTERKADAGLEIAAREHPEAAAEAMHPTHDLDDEGPK